MASIEGGGSVSGANGSANSGSNDGISADQIAENLAGHSTGPAGLEVDRYAASVDAAMDAANAGMHPGTTAAEIEAAAMAQLGPRQQAQFQRAIEPYRSSPSTALTQQIAMNAPFDRAYTDPYNAIGVNVDGQPINANGEVIADLPAQTFVEAGPTPFEQAQAQQRANGMRNVELITSGPFSGLFAAGGVIFGAEQRTIEGLAQTGQILDGLTTHMAPGPQDAMSMRP